MTSTDSNILDDYDDLRAIAEEMEDDDLTEAIKGVIKIIQKPDISPKTAAYLIVQLQGIAFKFGLLKVHYMYGGKTTRDKYRKNMYFSAVERVDKMVDALKYVAKV